MSNDHPTRETDRFNLEDLFFSRTDPRGVIQAANSVFVHVSGFDWSDLEGAPHRIVRHPDMPSGVFHLMWQEIAAGRPIGAYGRVTPEQSQDLLLQKLRDMGYPDYDTFMSYALSEELGARATGMRRRVDHGLQAMRGLAEAVHNMHRYGDMVDTIFHSTALIPNNLSIQARSLEGANGPISVISTNHQVMAQSLGDILRRFRTAVVDGVAHTGLARFNAGVRVLTQDVATQFRNNPAVAGLDSDAEARRLATLITDCQIRETASVSKVMRAVAAYRGMSTDMRRVMSGLEMSRVMCKIEQSKYAKNVDGLNEIVGRLHRAERQLSEVIDSIETSISVIEDRTNRLMPVRAA